jgi:TP901 family phage tail tape measure protein
MARLTIVAKQQGASTAFSATEAGQGLEFLALAGFSVDESITAIGPVLSAAAADGIGLGQAAEIVGAALKGMALPASDATRVADVLAKTSATTATSIADLGEGFKYAAPLAKTLGISVETTAGILGLVADAGVKGSAGGTSFAHALQELAKPSKEAGELIGQLGIKMTKFADGPNKGGLDIMDVFKQVNAKVSGIPDVMERARITTALFGTQGSKAFSAVATAINDPAHKADTLVQSLYDAKGAADEMAKARLDNFAGAMEQLKGAVEGFALETTGLFLGPAKESVAMYGDVLSDVVLAMTDLNAQGYLSEETANKVGDTSTQVAIGILDGIHMVIDAWKALRKQVTDFISDFVGSQSGPMIYNFAKIATVIVLIAAALAPVMAAFGALAFFISSVIVPAVAAVGSVFAFVFSAPVLAAVAIAVGAFLMFRNEGESVGQTLARMMATVVTSFTDGFNWIMANVVQPFISGFQYIPNVFLYVWEKIKEFAFNMKVIFNDLIVGIMSAFRELAPFFRVLFTFIGNIVGVIVAGIGLAFTKLLDVIKGVMNVVKNIILSVVESVVNFIKTLSFGIGYIGEKLGFDWGAAMQDFGQNEFHVQVGVERGMGNQMAEDAIDTTVSQELIDQAKNEALAMQVGQAVADNMPKTINVESKVCVDGKTIAKATATHQQELSERAGVKATPWQRRAAVEHGAAPVGG